MDRLLLVYAKPAGKQAGSCLIKENKRIAIIYIESSRFFGDDEWPQVIFALGSEGDVHRAANGYL